MKTLTETEEKQKEYYERKPSWKDAHKEFESMLADGKDLQKALATVAILTPRIIQKGKTLFNLLPEVDTRLISDTPLSERKLMDHVYRYLGRSSGQDVLVFAKALERIAHELHKEPDLVDSIKEAGAYAFKLEKRKNTAESKPDVQGLI